LKLKNLNMCRFWARAFGRCFLVVGHALFGRECELRYPWRDDTNALPADYRQRLSEVDSVLEMLQPGEAARHDPSSGMWFKLPNQSESQY
jgi:hypothetical protein